VLGSSVGRQSRERYGWRALSGAWYTGVLCALLGVVHHTRAKPRQFDSSQALGRKIHTRGYGALYRSTSFAFHLLIGGSVATLWSWGLMCWNADFLVRAHHNDGWPAGGCSAQCI